MKKLFVISSLTSAIILSGCSDPKEANKGNFAKALDEYLAKKSAICVSIKSDVIPVAGSPYSSDDKIVIANGNNGIVSKQLAFLEKYGLLSNEGKDDVEVQALIGGSTLAYAQIYTITEKAKPYLKGERLCSGKVVLDDIKIFSEPSEISGYKVSRVEYTIKHKDVADWAKDPELRNVFRSDFDLDEMELEQTDALVLTNEGWKREG